MVDFSLEGAHPAYAEQIEALIRVFLSKYPWAPIKRVALYRCDDDDRSLGNADTPGVISLNSFWFSKDPSVLQHEAIDGVLVPIDGQIIPWHRAAKEPEHLIFHECWHILADALPGWEKIVEPFWRSLTEDATNAPSGYAISGCAETIAEAGANYELGLAEPIEVEIIETLLQSRE